MDLRYSIYDAKARFSEVVKKASEGHSVIITKRNIPIVEIRAYEEKPNQTLAEHMKELERLGIVTPSDGKRMKRNPQRNPRPEILETFLAERD